MRMTPAIQRARAVADFQRLNSRYDQLQRQVSTGKRFEFGHEDPIYAGDVLAATRALSELGQSGRAQASARTRLETEDQVLSTTTEILARAKELAMAQGDAGASPETRASAAIEVNQLIDQLTALANTRVGSEYVFSGESADTAPFSGTTYVGGSLPRDMEILPGQRVRTAQTGQQLFVDSGVMSSMVALRDALSTGLQSPVINSLTGLDNAMTATEQNVADAGSRLRRVEIAETALADQEAMLITRKDRSGGIPAEEAMGNFLAVETALQTSAAALQRVLSLNITQYLR